MTATPLFSVIVPTYHRNEMLAKCLDRLARGMQTLGAERYEVIVTDDGSRTTAEQMILERYGWAKWVAGPVRGAAANRNNGARFAKGEWLAFCDDDCIPDVQWLEAYATALRSNPSCHIFEGRVYVDRPRKTLAEYSPIFEVGGSLPSGNFICRRSVFETLGGFDERYMYVMEDVDLRARILKAGYHFLFIREASVCHPWRPKGGWKKLKQHQQSTFIYLSIHPEERSRINSFYYLRIILSRLIRDTIPGCIKFKGKGITESLLEHLASLQMALFLVKRR